MTCKACDDTGVITSGDSVGMVDQYPCDLCATDVCEHGIRAPHECKQCADEPSDAEIADWMERRERGISEPPGAAVVRCQRDDSDVPVQPTGGA